MIFRDLVGLKLPDIRLTGEEKPQKNLTQETCPDRESKPGPLHGKRACYRLLHSGLLPNVWKTSYTISMSISVDVLYWPSYSMDNLISCVVLGSLQLFFRFGKKIVITSTQEKMTLCGTKPLILYYNARSHTSDAVSCATGNRRFWNSHHSHKSPCDYDLFAKVK